MGGGHGPAFHVVKEGKNGDGQGSAFRRIRPGSQLVKKTEGTAVRRGEDGNDIFHMTGKGTEALLDALLVSDIGKHVVEDGKL